MNLSSSPAPSGALRLLADARGSLAKNDFPQALQLLQRARGLAPNDDRVLLELGRVFALSYDFASAERCFENAVAISLSRPDAVLTAGHHWMDVRNFEAATRYFELALDLKPVRVVAYFRLTEMYARLRRLDDARAIIERGLADYPGHEGILLAKGKLLRQQRLFEEAELIFLQILSNDKTAPDARAAAGYELGALLDEQGCYEEAMEAVLEAKQILRHEAVPLMTTWRDKQKHLRDLTANVNGKVVQEWRRGAESDFQPRRNLALLCGHPRSGTTLLEYVLDSHPDLVSADETSVFQNKMYAEISRNLSRETSYTSVLSSFSPRTLRQVRSNYFNGIESFLGQPVGKRLLLDKNPAMTFDMPAFARAFPESKFLVALRDPRDVCISCFMQAWPVMPDTVPWLNVETTIDSYAALMGLWLALKPAMGPSAAEVRYEDMVTDLEGNTRRILSFLGLSWDEKVLRFHERAGSRVVRSPTYLEVTKPIYKTAMGRWKNYEKYFERSFARLEPFLKSFGYTATVLICLLRQICLVTLFGTLLAVTAGAVNGSPAQFGRRDNNGTHSSRRTGYRTDARALRSVSRETIK